MPDQAITTADASPYSLSSSVHPEETSQSFPPDGSYRDVLLSIDSEEAQATDELFAAIHPDPHSPERDRLRSCRTRAYFIRNIDTGEVRISANSCRSRWCLPCARARASTIAINVKNWIRHVRGPKLLTLTLQHSDAPLHAQLRELTVLFQRLRKKDPFSHAWRGGLWFLQVTRNSDTFQWHPHLHIILDGDYVQHSTIKRAWLKVTSTSDIVDIRAIRTPEYAARYVSRYVSRPMLLKDLPLDERTELYDAFSHKRLVGTFGTAKGANLLQRPTFDHSRWQRVGSWFWVTALASSDPRASEIWDAYWNRRPLSDGVTIYAYFDDLQGLPKSLEPEPPPLQGTFTYD
jgi:hypothetical protein